MVKFSTKRSELFQQSMNFSSKEDLVAAKQRRLPKSGFSIDLNLRIGTVIFASKSLRQTVKVSNFVLYELHNFLNKFGIVSYRGRLSTTCYFE